MNGVIIENISDIIAKNLPSQGFPEPLNPAK